MSLIQRKISYSFVLTPISIFNQITQITLSTLLLWYVTSFIHPVWIKMFCEVVPDVVRHHYDYYLILTKVFFLTIFDCSVHSSSTTSTSHQSFFFSKPSSHDKALFVRSFNPLIYNCSIKISGNKVVTNTFSLLTSFRGWEVFVEFFRDGQYRTRWVNSNNYDVWI